MNDGELVALEARVRASPMPGATWFHKRDAKGTEKSVESGGKYTLKVTEEEPTLYRVQCLIAVSGGYSCLSGFIGRFSDQWNSFSNGSDVKSAWLETIKWSTNFKAKTIRFRKSENKLTVKCTKSNENWKENEFSHCEKFSHTVNQLHET